MKKQMKSAFSLMEMMVVLLIISIIAAASAPMVTKKLARNVGGNESAWFYTGLNTNSIAYLPENNASAMIGGTRVKDGTIHPKLYIETSSDEAAIGIGNSSNNTVLSLVADTRSANAGGQRVGLTNLANNQFGRNSVAIGVGQGISGNTPEDMVLIGSSATGRQTSVVVGGNAIATGDNCVVVGTDANRYATKSAGNSVVVGSSARVSANYATAIGTRSEANGEFSIAIGSSSKDDGYADAKGKDSIAIGRSSLASYNSDAQHIGGSVAIGSGASATGLASIAIGSGLQNGGVRSQSPQATEFNSMAIGAGAEASAINTVAIGVESKAAHINSVAIGNGSTTAKNQIVLGSSLKTVYIPGNLVVDGDVILAHNNNAKVWFGGRNNTHFWLHGYDGSEDRDSIANDSEETHRYKTLVSDRRLKNVGKKFTGGLEELKKLDLYHFTFKKDEKKTPHVGVMAQDLQKVFPDAVTTGDDGYLRIRWDEMFYALVNAVKELDNKIAEIAQQVKSTLDLVNKQQTTIEAQQKTIDALVKQNAEFEKRLEKLEKAK